MAAAQKAMDEGIANTDNVTSELDLVIPANNRGRKSLATVYWLLAREILQDSKEMKYEIDDFETKTAEVEEELQSNILSQNIEINSVSTGKNNSFWRTFCCSWN